MTILDGIMLGVGLLLSPLALALGFLAVALVVMAIATPFAMFAAWLDERKRTRLWKERNAYVEATRKRADDEREQQRISFAYGNVSIDNPNVTREMVEDAARREKNR